MCHECRGHKVKGCCFALERHVPLSVYISLGSVPFICSHHSGITSKTYSKYFQYSSILKTSISIYAKQVRFFRIDFSISHQIQSFSSKKAPAARLTHNNAIFQQTKGPCGHAHTQNKGCKYQKHIFLVKKNCGHAHTQNKGCKYQKHIF